MERSIGNAEAARGKDRFDAIAIYDSPGRQSHKGPFARDRLCLLHRASSTFAPATRNPALVKDVELFDLRNGLANIQSTPTSSGPPCSAKNANCLKVAVKTTFDNCSEARWLQQDNLRAVQPQSMQKDHCGNRNIYQGPLPETSDQQGSSRHVRSCTPLSPRLAELARALLLGEAVEDAVDDFRLVVGEEGLGDLDIL